MEAGSDMADGEMIAFKATANGQLMHGRLVSSDGSSFTIEVEPGKEQKMRKAQVNKHKASAVHSCAAKHVHGRYSKC